MEKFLRFDRSVVAEDDGVEFEVVKLAEEIRPGKKWRYVEFDVDKSYMPNQFRGNLKNYTVTIWFGQCRDEMTQSFFDLDKSEWKFRNV